jgi:hypothetical protein
MVNGSAVLKQQQHHETIVKNESHAISECNSNHLSHGSHFVIFFWVYPSDHEYPGFGSW